MITDFGWFEVKKGEALILREIAPDLTVDDVRAGTEAAFIVADDLKPVSV